MTRRLVPCLIVACLALALGGCEQLGLEDPAKVAAIKEAEGKAIGGACRHSGRALEDCYVMNPRALKAAIYAGWRDMDAYMRENNIQAVVPDLVDAPAGAKAPEPAPEVPAGDKKAAAAPRKAG
ncbi:MAG: hypothetical protein IPJ52_05205 [Rhodocyclaceae bacterium]|nr:hypothetical protein [Rhodocyclaceae bacterium]